MLASSRRDSRADACAGGVRADGSLPDTLRYISGLGDTAVSLAGAGRLPCGEPAARHGSEPPRHDGCARRVTDCQDLKTGPTPVASSGAVEAASIFELPGLSRPALFACARRHRCAEPAAGRVEDAAEGKYCGQPAFHFPQRPCATVSVYAAGPRRLHCRVTGCRRPRPLPTSTALVCGHRR